MYLSELELKNFRNFDHLELTPSESFNIILGDNGRGKTSLLEAIYFLCMGRSFRGQSYLTAIQNKQTFFRLVGSFSFIGQKPERSKRVFLSQEQHLIGLEKHVENTRSQLKFNGEVLPSHTPLLKLFPIQIIHHENFHLLDAGPQFRREFLDWGVFYGEPKFLPVWQNFQRALKQRNALLKNMDHAQCDFWEKELGSAATQIDQYRRLYLTLFMPVLEELLQSLGIIKKVSFDFYSGWDREKDYGALLNRTRQRDEILGFTQHGPHRADIKIRLDQFDVDHVLSRGQQKMLSFAMRIAQTLLLHRLTQQASILLLDDLTAELDAIHISQAFSMLALLPSQIFITGIHQELFNDMLVKFPSKKLVL